MASLSFVSFLRRPFVASVSGGVLVACTSALGNFTIDDTVDGGSGGSKDSGGSSADGASAVDGSTDGVDSGGTGTVEGGSVKAPCTKDGKFVFVTKDDAVGSFATGSGTNPIAEADARCQLAAAGKLPGIYHAWLSTGAPNAASPGSLPTTALFLPKCTQVKQAGSSGGGKLMNPIDEDQSGQSVGPGPAWTATTSQGAYPGGGTGITSTTCGNWVVSAASGIVGNIGATDDTWSDNGQPIPCTNRARFYCIQQ